MNLDDVFLIDGGGELDIPPPVEVVLDEVNDLNTVIRLSLEAYKSMMEDITFIEVKNRVKHLEVAERYLSTAKDAIYKKEQLVIAQQKAAPKTAQSPAADSDELDTSGSTRDELYEMRRLRAVKGS